MTDTHEKNNSGDDHQQSSIAKEKTSPPDRPVAEQNSVRDMLRHEIAFYMRNSRRYR